MLRTAILLIAGIASASTLQTTDPVAEAARNQDVYAVYSVLMTNPPVIGGDSNKTYAIAALTTPANLDRGNDPALPEEIRRMVAGCDAPPPGYEDQWQEILAEFRSRSDAPVPMLRELKITKPYIYLTDEEGGVFKSVHNSTNAPIGPNAQFGGAVAVVSLSNVYFNRNRTLAVVRISSSCGMLCGQGERKIYEKTATAWREVTGGVRCVVSS